MIDLRCHILTGTACGPHSFTESVEMCRRAAQGGVRTLVATPYWKAGTVEPPLSFENITHQVGKLQKEFGGSLGIKSGFVFEFDSQLPELVDQHGARLTLDGKKYLLLSLPSMRLPTEIDSTLAAMMQRGFGILLAHPECSPALRRNPAILKSWAARGTKFQIDAASVAGVYGREVRKFALECLRRFEGSVVVASNMRNTNPSSLIEARKEITKHLGELRTAKTVIETPAAILSENGSPVKADSKAQGRIGSLLRSIKQLGALVSEQ